MGGVGVLALFEVQPGRELEIERFFQRGRLIVDGQPPSTSWFAFRIDPTTYGAFAAFANDEDREALLSTGGPALSRSHRDLFIRPPTFHTVELLQARQLTPASTSNEDLRPG